MSSYDDLEQGYEIFLRQSKRFQRIAWKRSDITLSDNLCHDIDKPVSSSEIKTKGNFTILQTLRNFLSVPRFVEENDSIREKFTEYL